MPNPFDPWSWLNTLFEWFIGSWTQSGGQALQSAIAFLTAAQFPNLGEQWFMTLWNSTFGLSLLIGLAAIMVHAVVFMFKARYATLGASLVGFVKLAFNGGFLLLIVVVAMGLVDFLISLVTAWISGILDFASWTQPFASVLDMNGINIWLKLCISNAGMIIGNLLYLQSVMMNFWIYIFVIWYLLGSALGTGKVAQFVRSMIFAVLLTTLFARVFQVFHLGLSAIVLSVGQSLGMQPIVILLGVVASGAIALLIPVFMMVAFTIASFKVERRLDVRAFIENQTRNTTYANTGELADERAGRLRAIGDSTKEAAGGVIRWAAVIAATAAIAKIGTGVAAKIAGAAPTPQTKLVAVGLLAARAGTNWVEGKTRSYIDNRVGRPGENRARTRQRSTK
jgi:hypothetical protein